MLILVAVTITMAVNGGLFEYAGKAVGEMQNAIDEEQQLANGRIKIGGVWYDSIDDYLKGNPSITGEHNWTREVDTFTCSHCNATYIMGQVVNYTPEGKTSTTLTAAKSGLDKYYTANSNSYPNDANVDENGTQTIEAQTVRWIVLGIEDTDGDGINETLLITTKKPVGVTTNQDLWFYGAAGYNNAVDEINRICRELYSNSKYGQARGMTIKDVNNALNYSPHGGEYYDADNTCITTGNFTTKLKDLPIFSSLIQNGTNTPDGTNTEEVLGEYELNGYYYWNEDLTLVNEINDEPSSITEVESNIIFGKDLEYYYWLASRSVAVDSEGAYFGSDLLGFGEVRACSGYFNSRLDGQERECFALLRPVIPIRGNLPGGPALISFTIDEVTYTAEEGMTWEDWINSEDYDSHDWSIGFVYNKLSVKIPNRVYLYNVDPGDLIMNGVDYVCDFIGPS